MCNSWICLYSFEKKRQSFVNVCKQYYVLVVAKFWAEAMDSSSKCLNDGFVYYKHAAFCFSKHKLMDFFISCLDSHSDGTHSLQRIHW